jgi:hypothetical protein
MAKIQPTEQIKIIPLFENLDFSNIKSQNSTRDWVHKNSYRCVPMNLGSELGYIIESPFDFWVEWLGGPSAEEINYTIFNNNEREKWSIEMSSIFGNGIITFHPRFVLNTPDNINLLIKQPPNDPKHGIQWLEAMVEADNLFSSFTFNLKITKPNEKVYFKKGEPIASFIPYPRFFADNFDLSVSSDVQLKEKVDQSMAGFHKVRPMENEQEMSNSTYRKGHNFDGCPFHNKHQIKLGYESESREENLDFFKENEFRNLKGL